MLPLHPTPPRGGFLLKEQEFLRIAPTQARTRMRRDLIKPSVKQTMKTNIAAFSICLTLLVPLAGCKKSGQSGGNSGSPAAAGSRSPDEAARLQIKWPVGNRYVERMELKQNSEMVMPQMPQPMKQNLTMGQEYALSVLQERAGGGRELEMEFLAIQMDMSMGGQSSMAFDSKGEAIDEES